MRRVFTLSASHPKPICLQRSCHLKKVCGSAQRMLSAGWGSAVAAQMDAPAREAALHCGAQPQNQCRCRIAVIPTHPQPPDQSKCYPLGGAARPPRVAQISPRSPSGSQRGHRDSETSLESLRAVCEQGVPSTIPLQVLTPGVTGGAPGGAEADSLQGHKCSAAGESLSFG